MRHSKMKKSGFTLIELLVAVTIIAILMTIAIPSYNKFVAKGRDTRRQSDIKIVQSALEQYKLDQGFYPSVADLPWGAALASPNGTKTYNNKLPKDPLDTQSTYPKYMYKKKPDACDNTTTLCSSYCLYLKTEDASLADKPTSCNSGDPQGIYSNYLLP
jgi:type II secretion system protein G